MGNLTKWNEYSVEEAKKEAEELKGGGEIMALKQGRSLVRFLPSVGGKKTPFRFVFQHYLQTSPTEDKKVVFVCPRKEANQPCPMCESADKLKRSGNEKDYDEARNRYPRPRIFANVVDRENPEKGVMVLAFPKKVLEQLHALMEDPDVGGDFTHPTNGYDVIIKRSGTGKFDTEYRVLPGKKCALGNMDWIDQQHDLDRFAILKPMEEIRKLVLGDGAPDDEPRKLPGKVSGQRPAKQRTAEDDVMGEAAPEDVPF